MANYKVGLKKIKAFVFDVDGVLGSDKVLLSSEGEMLRTMNIKDGYAMQYAVRKGYRFAIITGGNTESIRIRFNNLGIEDIYMKSHNKLRDYENFKALYDIKDEEILYMGDDLPDYEVMQLVGVATCPSDAVDEIKKIAHYISDRKGGDGAVRDVVQQVLKIQEKWMEADAFKW